MNTQFKITEAEKACVARRTAEIHELVCTGEKLKGYYTYAIQNGYSEAEAHKLVDEQIIPVVDNYNASCREAAEADQFDWIQNRIAKASEKMDPQAAVKYKLSVLQSIRSLNALAVGEEIDDVLNPEEEALLNAAEYSDDMIRNVDTALADAIEHSALPLIQNRKFMEFLDGKSQDQPVKAAVWEMWQDEKLKYAAALAVCVARHNQELPSIPGNVTDQALIIGACQGIDVANMESKLAVGEIQESAAQKILRTIAVVGMTVLACVVLADLFGTATVYSMVLGIQVFGANVIGLLAGSFFVMGDVAILYGIVHLWLDKGVLYAGKCFDTVYGAIRSASGKLHTYLEKNLIPAVHSCISAVTSFFGAMVRKISSVFTASNNVYAKA